MFRGSPLSAHRERFPFDQKFRFEFLETCFHWRMGIAFSQISRTRTTPANVYLSLKFLIFCWMVRISKNYQFSDFRRNLAHQLPMFQKFRNFCFNGKCYKYPLTLKCSSQREKLSSQSTLQTVTDWLSPRVDSCFITRTIMSIMNMCLPSDGGLVFRGTCYSRKPPSIVKSVLINFISIDVKRFHVACVCSVIAHRWRQNVVRTEKWHTIWELSVIVISFHILTCPGSIAAQKALIYLFDIIKKTKTVNNVIYVSVLQLIIGQNQWKCENNCSTYSICWTHFRILSLCLFWFQNLAYKLITFFLHFGKLIPFFLLIG